MKTLRYNIVMLVAALHITMPLFTIINQLFRISCKPIITYDLLNLTDYKLTSSVSSCQYFNHAWRAEHKETRCNWVDQFNGQ